MLIWIVAPVLTALVTGAVLWPIFRRRQAPTNVRADYDIEVFGAQLRELEADVDRQAIPVEDAAVARAEIGRRLLKASALSDASAHAGTRPTNRLAVTVAVVLVGVGLPATTVSFYSLYGSPELPDLPLAARLAVDPGHADLPTLVAQVETRLRQDPEEGAGWDMLAPIYLRIGRPEDAGAAARNAIRLLGPTAVREATLGEALTQRASGEVTDEAKATFERALKLNPDFLPAKFFLALDLSQESRFAEASSAWRKLAAESPERSPWLDIANLAIADAEEKLAAAPGGPDSVPPAIAGLEGPRGPSTADIAAAGDMAEGDRRTMIEGMVSQLAERLKSAPNDLEGWKRLMRSYTVLGDAEQARAAFAEAGMTFAEGSRERAELDRFAASLGLIGDARPPVQ